jgi:hypothetical protein
MGLSDFPPAFIAAVSYRIRDADLGPSFQATDGISRFPCEEFPYVHGVYDHAGSENVSR